MTHYPAEENSARKLLRLSVKLHYVTLKYTISFFLAMVILKYIALFSLSFSIHYWLQILVEIITGFIIFYFFAAGLHSAHYALMDKPVESMMANLKIIWEKKKIIYQTLVIYLLSVIAIFWLGKLIIVIVNRIAHNTTGEPTTAGIMIGAVLLIICAAMFYFSVPLAIIDKKPNHNFFYQSMLLSEKNKFGILLSYSILGATLLLLAPGMPHEYFLHVYHLDIVFDFIVLSVAGPIYFNLLLLLINDSKLLVK